MRAIRAVLLTTLLGGCQTHTDACEPDPAITRSHAAWRSHHVRDYHFVWQQQCFCLAEARQPIRVTVHDGEIVDATGVGGAPVSDDVRRGLMTIDALYEAAVKSRCDATQVRVDSAGDGVPGHVYIDPKEAVADDEFDVTISEFAAGAGG